MSTHLTHVFDLTIDADPGPHDRFDAELELFAEELQAGTHTWSDCLSSASSFSCSGTLGSLGTVGSITSCGS